MIRLDDIMPLPVPEEKKRMVVRAKPPSSVYTSPESLKYIQEKDKDADVNFDEEPESKKRRGPVRKKTDKVKGRGRGRGVRSMIAPQTIFQALVEQGRGVGRGRGRRGGGRPTTKVILEKNRVDRQGDEAEFEDDDVVGVPCPESNEMGKAGEKLPIIKGRSGFIYCICTTKFEDEDDLMGEDEWVFCPQCEVMSHLTCIKVS